VILLDEVDLLQDMPWAKTFFNNIRALTQAADRDFRAISWVIAGTLAIDSLYKEAGSPFVNVLAAKLKLGPLTRDESLALIQDPLGGRVPKAVAERVYLESGGHPFLIQFLMHHLYDDCGAAPHRLTPESITKQVNWFFDTRSEFEFWTRSFGDAELLAYSVIAGSDKPTRKAEVLGKIGDPTIANHALTQLANCAVIRQVERNHFVCNGEMFRTWFFENRVPERPPAPNAVSLGT